MSNQITNFFSFLLACTCGPVPCPQDTSCYIENSDNRCKDLELYLKCMKSLSKKCRGDIGYHSAITVNSAQYKRECTAHDEVSHGNTNEHSQSMEPITNNGACPSIFDDKKGHRFCGLFGDPHLRTYDGKYQTCRIHGAWQVIENSFFGIMVTNDAVFNSTTATAPTKVCNLFKALYLI